MHISRKTPLPLMIACLALHLAGASAEAQLFVAGPTEPISQVCSDWERIYPNTQLTDIGDGLWSSAHDQAIYPQLQYTGYSEDYFAAPPKPYTVVVYKKLPFPATKDPANPNETCWTALVNYLEGDPGKRVYNNSSTCYKNLACKKALERNMDAILAWELEDVSTYLASQNASQFNPEDYPSLTLADSAVIMTPEPTPTIESDPSFEIQTAISWYQEPAFVTHVEPYPTPTPSPEYPNEIGHQELVFAPTPEFSATPVPTHSPDLESETWSLFDTQHDSAEILQELSLYTQRDDSFSELSNPSISETENAESTPYPSPELQGDLSANSGQFFVLQVNSAEPPSESADGAKIWAEEFKKSVLDEPKLLHTLQNFAKKETVDGMERFVVSQEEVEALKKRIFDVLGFPNGYRIQITANKVSGSAIHGDLIRGSIQSTRAEAAISPPLYGQGIAFAFDMKAGTLSIDKMKNVEKAKIADLLTALHKNGLPRELSNEELVQRVTGSGQRVYYSGEKGKDLMVIVTADAARTPESPYRIALKVGSLVSTDGAFHRLYLGSEKEGFQQVLLTYAAAGRNGSLELKGTLKDSTEVNFSSPGLTDKFPRTIKIGSGEDQVLPD